jgi:hypothetical protein
MGAQWVLPNLNKKPALGFGRFIQLCVVGFHLCGLSMDTETIRAFWERKELIV